MTSQSPPKGGHNNLLHLLNPYSSMARSTLPPGEHDPDSPSTMLLRELSGEDAPSEEDGRRPRSRARGTPTPSRPVATSPESRSSEDEGPPRDIIFGEPEGSGSRSRGDRTPVASPPKERRDRTGRMASPGPFGEPGPSSSSASGRSRSTSPGPSTISVYASGLDGTGLEEALASAAPSSPDTSTSPAAPPRPLSSARKTPTFREVPMVRPSTARTLSGGSKGKSKDSRRGSGGYLDPPLASPSDRRGKGKAKSSGGRKYHALAAEDEDEIDQLEEPRSRHGSDRGVRAPRVGLNEYERALWKWVNVEDLDGFLQEVSRDFSRGLRQVYAYYKGKGIWCIALARFLNLITTFFVIGFSTFLSSCIDYSKLNSKLESHPEGVERLDDVIIPQCLSGGSFPHRVFLFCVAAVYIFQLASFLLAIPRLLDMYRFYTHLLGIPDTLPWPEIVRLIGEIRKHNPITSLSNGQGGALAEMLDGEDQKGQITKLDAHDVANRILRQENYLIALFNKELLDLTVRLPLPHSVDHLVPTQFLAPPQGSSLPSNNTARERKFLTFGENGLTKALEWNLRFCLMGYLFDRRGQVRKEFVRERRRKDLVEGLKRRFIFMGVLNAIFAPFIVVYLLIYSFFRYFEVSPTPRPADRQEYHKNPSSIGSRGYTPYAQWKFREFNELPHLFERRLDRSYPTAKEYIDQFPKERTALVMRFVAFIAGSFAAVLLVASLLDPDLVLHFEITPHRTVLFYLGIFGSVLAIARGMVPEENLVFDPEASLRDVVRWTHYLPGEWKGKLHSQMVHAEFSKLFALKISIFFTELLSVLLTPWVLFFSLPECAASIIDFFREFTVHVDGIGYVCSFAVFDFRRHGNLGAEAETAGDEVKSPENPHLGDANGHLPGMPRPMDEVVASPGVRVQERDRARLRANENKMEKSFLHFKATHPDWQPDPSSSIFLDRMAGLYANAMTSPLSGSIYGGGRGLGLGAYAGGIPGPDDKLRERSRSYDRAWAKSSHLLRQRATSPLASRDPGLPTMEEADDDSTDPFAPNGADGGVAGVGGRGARAVGGMKRGEVEEAERMGWHARVGMSPTPRGDAEGDDEDDEGRFLRDVGMVGILQQIMKTRQ